MESIHVKFDELIAMASECNNSGPGFNCSNFQDSLKDTSSIPLKEDLDNLFGPLYEEYYATRKMKTPQIVTSIEEQVANDPTTLVSNVNADESIQEDVSSFDRNNFYNPFHTPVFEEAESSSTFPDPSNMHEFHQKHYFTDIWTKNNPIEQVTVSTMEPKNNKQAMLDHSRIESMQDELNYFKRLDVWELVERPVGRSIITVHQSPRKIFISQSQYTLEILKKHEMEKCDSISTPMVTARIDADLQGILTDQTKYHSMIGGLMYLTASRPDIAFATFVYARYHARPPKKHLKEVKRIFRYLRQTINMGLWYSKDSEFELITYLNADHAECHDDCKSTSGDI
ncbi:hypothetical protein Tco_1185334 [Tanacetum coccineum]